MKKLYFMPTKVNDLELVNYVNFEIKSQGKND